MNALIIYSVLALIIGIVIGWLFARMQSSRQMGRFESQADQITQLHIMLEKSDAETENWRQQSSQAEARLEAARAQMNAEQKAAAERIELLQRARQEMSDSFRAVAGEALKQSEERFLTLAEQNFKRLQEGAQGDLAQRQEAIVALVSPVREGLDKMDQQLRAMENVRTGAYHELREELRQMTVQNTALRQETQSLAQALRAPKSRGSWGEMQLRRVVELAGMQAHVDFVTQHSVTSDDQRQQPDMVVKLPGNRCIVVDSKVPLDAFLQAANLADPALREPLYANHARQFAQHVKDLSKKTYWQQFANTPDFVVMFVPGEHYFAVAVEHQPDLIDRAMDQGVIIASPTTLLALLRAVHFGWRQESLADNARKIGDAGQELYERLSVFINHLGNVGKGLSGAIGHYNKTIASLESRIMPTLKKMQDLNVVDAEGAPEIPSMIEQIPRPILVAEGSDAA